MNESLKVLYRMYGSDMCWNILASSKSKRFLFWLKQKNKKTNNKDFDISHVWSVNSKHSYSKPGAFLTLGNSGWSVSNNRGIGSKSPFYFCHNTKNLNKANIFSYQNFYISVYKKGIKNFFCGKAKFFMPKGRWLVTEEFLFCPNFRHCRRVIKHF